MKLLRNFLYNSAYQLLVLFLPFITMPYISRVLGPRGIGINSYTYSIVMFFTLFGSLGLSIYGAREIATVQDNIKDRSAIFWNVFLLKCVTVVIAWVLFMLFIPTIDHHYNIYYYAQSILFLTTMLDVSWYFAGMEQFKTIVIRNTLLKLVTVGLVFIYVKNVNDLVLYIIFINIGNLIANVSMVFGLKDQIQKPVYSKIFNSYFFIPLLPALALFLPNIAANVYLLLNKVMIGQLDSVISAGFYQQSDSIIKIVVAIITSLGTVLMPRVSSLYSEKKFREIKKYVYKSMNFSLALSFPLMLGIIGISSYFVPWFFGPGYESVVVLIRVESITLVLIAISNVLGMQFLVPTRRTRDFTISITTGAIVNIALNPFLIMRFGALGAMVATVVAELVVVIVQMYLLRNAFNFLKLFSGVWKYFICALIMALAIIFINHHLELESKWIIILCDVVIGIFTYVMSNILFRTDIVMELNHFRKHKF
ncbi:MULTISPECIES: flippase [Leuconostoc]|uniref:Flippase n=1 Tax=Leuconostoc gelidum subsp. gelidum TaxID=1607839 RepID=A0AB35FX42_LEUGE|nr:MULTISPECIES: flippase [Leuconostoc]MBB6432326.1 O-antigen/teichoic acid export membrane protein [Leuconostoc carnosum]MBZ6015194.1 flippase [Leuconostoc gelidum subsp. gelidum]MDV8936259.1 flippase [Leuconostoc sp.]